MLAPRKPINVKSRTSRNNEIEDIKLKHPGPYMARVVSHLDKKFGGGLEVELVKSTSVTNTYEHEQQTYVVYYASPFYGVTPLQKNDANDTYASSQQSYGFWAVPPDPGSLVMVVFIEGNASQGFWIACIQDEYMNFMVPEPRVSTTLTTPSTPTGLAGKKLPVAEYNKFLANPNNNYPTSQPRPYNETFVERLMDQGLLDDDVRGTTSTSSRREAPSNVYGMSTPGPIDKRPGSPTVERGVRDSKATVFASRLSGHSIVMDDGDETVLRAGSPATTPKEYIKAKKGSPSPGDVTLPANELFRIRTRTGHQILLHNTEDLIYIGNSRGTTWIELSSNGKIDIFAQDSVSVHTQQDLNVTADRDINFTAFENINMVAGKDFRLNVGEKFNVSTGDRMSINSGNSISFKATSFISAHADSAMSLSSGGDSFSIISGSDLVMQAAADIGMSSATSIRASASGSLQLKSEGKVAITSTGADMNLKSSSNMNIESTASVHTKAGSAVFIQSSNSMNLLSGANIYAQSAAALNLLANGKMAIQATGGPITVDGGKNVLINSGNSASSATGADSAVQAADPIEPSPEPPTAADLALMPSRVPQHEPWLQHENLNPENYVPEKTRAGLQPIDSFAQLIPDTYLQRPGSTVGTTGSSYGYPVGDLPSGDIGTSEEDLTGPLPSGDNVRIAHQYFISKGLTPEQSAGIVGNLMAESSPAIDPLAYNKAGGGNGARGIAQWRNPRIQPFRDRYNKDILEGTLAEQLDYIWYEFNTTEKPALKHLKQTTTVKDAALSFDDKFERSGGHSREPRIRYANDVMRLYLANYDSTVDTGSLPYVSDANGSPVPFEFEEFDDTGNLTMRVEELQHEKASIRTLPIVRSLKDILNYAAHASGVTKVVVVSGGQPHRSTGGKRKGSFRHDVSQPGARSGGMAADFDLYVGGKRLDGNNLADRAIMSAFIAHAVSRGVRAVGWDSGVSKGQPNYYMGSTRIHMDPYGASETNRSLAIWGHSESKDSAVQWVYEAAKRGMPK